MKIGALVSAVLVLAGCLAGTPAVASVVISGTRVILSGSVGETTVQLQNTGSSPALVQSWVDAGDPGQTPEQTDVPFLITPPITRINAGQGQALRVFQSGGSLPQDRESVFWLNVLEVPPMPQDDEGGNYLQFAIRSRLKLFYRPEGLPGSAATAPKNLTWELDPEGAVHVHNPSAFHITITRLEAFPGEGGEDGVLLETSGLMVSPGGGQRWDLRSPAARVEFTTVNDYGARVARSATVAPRRGP